MTTLRIRVRILSNHGSPLRGIILFEVGLLDVGNCADYSGKASRGLTGDLT